MVREWEEYNGGKWENIKVAADSGACRTVASKEVAKEYELTETAEPNSGKTFTAVNGNSIGYYGMRRVDGVSQEGVPVRMDWAVAGVQRTLAAVGNMCDAGNRVTIEKEGGDCEQGHL